MKFFVLIMLAVSASGFSIVKDYPEYPIEELDKQCIEVSGDITAYAVRGRDAKDVCASLMCEVPSMDGVLCSPEPGRQWCVYKFTTNRPPVDATLFQLCFNFGVSCSEVKCFYGTPSGT